MAKIRANKKAIQRKRDTRIFEGTCSNCRLKKVDVTKVGSAQVCLDKCLNGIVNYQNPTQPMEA